MEINKGDVVVSLAGRDKGKYFFVLTSGDIFVTIVDGKIRKLSAPKVKKCKHVGFISNAESRVREKILNSERLEDAELRKALRLYDVDSAV